MIGVIPEMMGQPLIGVLSYYLRLNPGKKEIDIYADEGIEEGDISS